ncbi:MAG: tRNA1(Val) (adenine(37)-N6)-methyltransferase [Firmicutes bacterium]|nr:tRNA1(Val) (adenine(37)-N6)-methyltransferase [Bacillota bacterium]
MEVLNDIVGYKNRKIYQCDKYFSFSLDSLILANFVNINLSDKKIIDLGTGNGIIPLVMSLRTDKRIIGIEIQNELVQLANKSIKYNNLEDQIEILNIDMKDYVNDDNLNTVDLITCNPPYFKFSNNDKISLSKEKAIARHEIEITLSEIISISNKLLKNGGRLALVIRTDRFYEALNLCKNNNIEPKRIRFVYDNPSKDASLFFFEGIKNGRSGLKVEKPFILYDEFNNKTKEYEKFLTEVIK